MGAIISKLCCCTGRSTRSKFSSPPKPPPPKLSRNPSLIIERSVKFLRDAEEGSEYSRVLERDFEIKGKGKENKSLLRDEEITCKINSNTLKTFQVKHKESGQLFNLTRIKKSFLSKSAAGALCREIKLLADGLPNHPMLVNLYWTWQDEKYLYRVDDDYDGDGEDMRIFEKLNLREMERVASQLAVVIHYIHSYGMVHGNISPRSVHIATDPIKLGSFGYLRKMQGGGKKLKGICGDWEEFRAPECETLEGYFEEIDWYSYGKTLQYYKDQSAVISDELADLIEKLTERRLGYGPAGFKSIQSHPFFCTTDWSLLLTRQTEPVQFTSLSTSIESLKSQSTAADVVIDGEWRGFVEFSWEERGEIGQMLETIIKRIQ